MSHAQLDRLEGDVRDARRRMKSDLEVLRAPETFSNFKQEVLSEARQSRDDMLAGRLLARPVLAILGVLPLLVLGFIAFKAVGSGFMPAMDEGGFIIDYLSPPGTALSETDRLVRQVEAILAAIPEVATWSRRTGAGLGGDLAEPNKGDFM